MKIEHAGMWVKDLEAIREFYEAYFNARHCGLYTNDKKHFSSYFLTFDSGCRLEIMHNPAICAAGNEAVLGLAHLAFSLGSEDAVLALTEHLRSDGYRVVGEPRTTGDGYYESVVLDPEGNRVELTV